MEENRYTNTLAEVPAQMVGIERVGIPMGLITKRTEDGYVLSDGCAVMDSSRDANGFYIGGVGMDGMYLATENRYEPVFDDDGCITAFRQINSYVLNFSPEQQTLIAQYALNTREHLMQDLTELTSAALPAELAALVRETINMLGYIPDEPCRQMMADLYWVYRERNLRSLQEKLAQNSEYDTEE